MRIRDWSSAVCSSDLAQPAPIGVGEQRPRHLRMRQATGTGERLVGVRDEGHRIRVADLADHTHDRRARAVQLERIEVPGQVEAQPTERAVAVEGDEHEAPARQVTEETGYESQKIGGTGRPEDGRHLPTIRSEEHTSELQSLMRNSYAVFCFKKKKHRKSIRTDNKYTKYYTHKISK